MKLAAAWLGALLVIAWAVLTAWEHLRHREPPPPDDVQPVDPWLVYLVTRGVPERYGTFSRN